MKTYEFSLVGVDGNAFSLMGAVTSAMRYQGATRDEISEFRDIAMSGNYKHLMKCCMDMQTEECRERDMSAFH